VEYGATELGIEARFFDTWENPIRELYSNETFTMSMEGNNMIKHDLVVVK
jgi:hypothetical protein